MLEENGIDCSGGKKTNTSTVCKYDLVPADDEAVSEISPREDGMDGEELIPW